MSGMERFTQRARRVLSLAHQEAERLRQETINTEHLLLGLIEEDGGIAGRVLRELGLEPERVREMVERLGGIGTYRGGKIDLAPGTQQVLEYAIEEARRMGHHYIGTEHLLLGLVRSTDGLGMEVLRKLGVTAEQIRRQTRRILQESSSAPTGAPAGTAPAGGRPASSRQEKERPGGRSRQMSVSRICLLRPCTGCRTAPGHPRWSIGMYCKLRGPTYSARGRISRLLLSCSRTCAVQPATRLTAKTGVNRSWAMPST